jgi:hypothetical protein
MFGRVQVTEYCELRSIAYLDLDGHSRLRGVRAVKDEPLHLRSGNDGDLVHQGMPEQHAPESVAADADAIGQAVIGDEREDLKLGAAGEHVIQVAILHDALADAELPEVREDVRAAWRAVAGEGEEPDTEVEAAE